jgi:putative oxidoreductase
MAFMLNAALRLAMCAWSCDPVGIPFPEASLTTTRPRAFDAWAPRLLSVLRIVAAAIFVTSGTSKLLAFPAGMPPDGGTARVLTQVWIGGVLEVVGGTLLLLGLYVRPAAFVLSGMMAVAYFQFHAPTGFWPTMNGGVAAILYCFLWLYIWAAGGGPWSLDALRESRER